MSRDDFIGISFDALSLEDATQSVELLSEAGKFSFVVTPNVDHAVQLSRSAADAPVRAAYGSASLVLCDSRIIGVLARFCGKYLSIVPGSDLTRVVFAHLLRHGDRVVVIGGDTTTLDALRERFPGPDYHQHVPPMGFIRDTAAREEATTFVEEIRAKYTFFAVGFPQSELLAADLVKRAKAKGVGLCIGASIEFIIGTKQRAPLWMQQMSLEWLFRLLSEPKRLWRRYLMDGPTIFAIVLRWRITGRGV